MSIPNTPAKTFFITGGSSGFGEALARFALRQGDRVAATFRKPEQAAAFTDSHAEALGVVCDVTDTDAVNRAIATAADSFGGLDVVVNNAGYGSIGIVETATDEEIHRQFDVNVYGPLRVVRAAIPVLRKRDADTYVLNVTSIGGLSGSAGVALYNGTKFALEGIGEALAAELEPFGIHVTNIEPGPFRTKWAGASATIREPEVPGYEASAGKFIQYVKDADGKQVGDPARAAEAMWRVTRMDAPPVHLPLGGPAYKGARAKVKSLGEEIDRYESVGLPTDYTEAELAEMN